MFKRFRKLTIVRRAHRVSAREEAQGLAEYGLILGLIAIVCVIGLQTLGVAVAGSAGFTSLPMSF